MIQAQTRTDPSIVARGLTRSFGAKLALAPFDLSIGPGGVTGLLGPNGSGKSTWMRCLLGLVRPDAGSARVDGVELVGDGTPIRRRVAFAPGEIALYSEMRAGDHLDWFARGRDREAGARARRLAQCLGLPLEQRVRSFSHGMKRQLMFAAAMAPRVAVRILDEPTEGLDPSKRGEVLEVLREDARQGTTILLSSHHLGEVDRVCDRLVFLNAGHKIADETSATVALRARRYVRVTYAHEADVSFIASHFTRLGAASCTVERARIGVFLDSDDPREFLAHALADRSLPAPRSIEYGALSLTELYKELYGVEGC